MGECNGCAGADRAGCCDPVQLVFTQNQLRALGDAALAHYSDRDIDWILNDLTRIPYREGLARSPHLSQGGITMGLDFRGDMVMMHPVFYECRWYERSTKRCLNYDNRPEVCADYPWYGAPPDPAKAIPLECSYREDLPPTPVSITKKRGHRT